MHMRNRETYEHVLKAAAAAELAAAEEAVAAKVIHSFHLYTCTIKRLINMS